MARSSSIDLSTLHCATVPVRTDSQIKLSDCSLMCVEPIPSAYFAQGFYGFQGKEGLSIAGKAAISNGMNPYPVTIQTALEAPPLRANATRENLKESQFLNMMRSARSLIDFLAEFWYAKLSESGFTKAQLSDIDWAYPSRFVRFGERFIVDLLELPEFSHLKIVVYPAATKDGLVLPTGVIRKQDIGEAFLQYAPDQKVIID